jgi:hypothetical protein
MNFSKSKQVIDVDLNQLKTMSKALAVRIQQSGYLPDHILYVERAGILTGVELATFFNRPVSGITSRRSGSSVKSRFKLILRLLPRFVTHFLRRLELNSSIHDVQKKEMSHVKALCPQKERSSWLRMMPLTRVILSTRSSITFTNADLKKKI